MGTIASGYSTPPTTILWSPVGYNCGQVAVMSSASVTWVLWQGPLREIVAPDFTLMTLPDSS